MQIIYIAWKKKIVWRPNSMINMIDFSNMFEFLIFPLVELRKN